MNHIEKAYKAWRATQNDVLPIVVARFARSLAVTEKPRKYAGTGRWERTPAHNEIARTAALKRWAKARPRILPSEDGNEKKRNAVKSFWQTLTPEQRSERQRKAAKKMWKRRKAEA